MGDNSPISQKTDSELGLDVDATDAKDLSPAIGLGGDAASDSEQDDEKKKADGDSPASE